MNGQFLLSLIKDAYCLFPFFFLLAGRRGRGGGGGRKDGECEYVLFRVH